MVFAECAKGACYDMREWNTDHIDQKQDRLSAGIATAEKPSNILQVVARIEENLTSPLELEDLARTAQLSKFHFCRTFKRHIGMNPMKFVASLRIERAKRLLARKGVAVSAIAEEVGYRDVGNFIRQFKKLTGMTPTMYRETTDRSYDTGESGAEAAL